MLAHLRTEAYPVYSEHQYPPAFARQVPELTCEDNNAMIDEANGVLRRGRAMTIPDP